MLFYAALSLMGTAQFLTLNPAFTSQILHKKKSYEYPHFLQIYPQTPVQ